jgi:Protein of unknown function (DUF3667)
MSIHKKRRKVEICHNCHTVLSVETNFCPHCGQENHDLKVPLGHLAFEVFEGFTHFDTKFYNTMKAIFLSPGKITKDFLEGRRGRYVPPVRLYFLVAFVFFLALDKMIDNAVDSKDNFLMGMVDGMSNKTNEVKKTAKEKLKEEVDKAKEEVDDLKNSDDTTGLFEAKTELEQANLALKLGNKLDTIATKSEKKANSFINVRGNFDFKGLPSNEILDEMNIQHDDTLRKLVDKLPENQQRERLISIQKQIITDTLNAEPIDEPSNELRNYFTEVIGRNRQLQYTLIPHALKNNKSIKIKYEADTVVTIKGSDGSLQNTAYKKRILKMSNEELDSVLHRNKQVNFLGIKSLERGLLRNQTYYELAFNDDGMKAASEIAHLGVGTFSIMMFFLMPIVAFLLKIIYSKRTHSIISYPFRLFKYLWDWIMYLIRFRKVRKYRHIPHLMAGQTRYYYEHLIFSIHIHAIFFLMILIFVGGGMAIGFPGSTLTITMLGFFLYFIISLKTVYRQGILKTLVKSMILFFMYVMTFIMVLTFTGVFKFALA